MNFDTSEIFSFFCLGNFFEIDYIDVAFIKDVSWPCYFLR